MTMLLIPCCWNAIHTIMQAMQAEPGHEHHHGQQQQQQEAPRRHLSPPWVSMARNHQVHWTSCCTAGWKPEYEDHRDSMHCISVVGFRHVIGIISCLTCYKTMHIYIIHIYIYTNAYLLYKLDARLYLQQVLFQIGCYTEKNNRCWKNHLLR